MFVEHKEQGESQTKELDEAGTLLLKAAALIEEQGHIRGCGQRDGPHCIISAIYHANGQRFSWSAEDRVAKSIPGRALVFWNDSPERTKDEVVAKLRAVALGL